MPYVDGYLLPLSVKRIDEYRRLARKASKVWREHGALEYRECAGDELATKFGVSFTKATKTKKGETVIFAWIVFKSKAHRDKVNAKVLKDPRITGMDVAMCPFDPRRMVYGGFKVIVSA